MSEQKNVSVEMVPADRTVLCIELSCWRDEPVWQASDEEVYRIALRDMMKMGYGVTESRGRGLLRRRHRDGVSGATSSTSRTT